MDLVLVESLRLRWLSAEAAVPLVCQKFAQLVLLSIRVWRHNGLRTASENDPTCAKKLQEERTAGTYPISTCHELRSGQTRILSWPKANIGLYPFVELVWE